MRRRASYALVLVLASLTLAACSASPTAPTSTLQSPGAAQHDLIVDDCRSGWSTSSGRAC